MCSAILKSTRTLDLVRYVAFHPAPSNDEKHDFIDLFRLHMRSICDIIPDLPSYSIR